MKSAKKFSAFAAMAATVVFAYSASAAWNGHRYADAISAAVDIAYAGSQDAVILQRGFDVNITNNVNNNVFGFVRTNTGIYLLEGGTLNVYKDWYVYGAYNQLRILSGDFHVRNLLVYYGSIPKSFVFGGSGIADVGWYGSEDGSNPNIDGDAVFAFMDNVTFVQPLAAGVINVGSSYHRVWAYNGGTAEYIFQNDSSGPSGDFFAFNGGTRIYRSRYVSDYVSATQRYPRDPDSLNKNLFGNNPKVRIYEGGGELLVVTNDCIINGYDFKVPTGAVKSIALTDEARNNNGELWEYPPAVVISDLGGTGSDAEAVVDYDFDNKIVTNITILSGGENYTEPVAYFKMYDRDIGGMKDLLSAPLVCETYNPVGGDFTYAATNLGSQVWIDASTNFTHGSIIVDMDRLGLSDYGKTQTDVCNTLVLYYYGTKKAIPRFENCTNIVMKSGCLCVWSSWGFNHDYLIPKCYSLELYGGHISGGTFAATNVVVGGTVYLTGHNLTKAYPLASETSPYHVDLNVTAVKAPNIWRTIHSYPNTPGTMIVDVDSPYGAAVLRAGTARWTANDVPGGYVYGGAVRFGGSPSNPCTLTVKNYESLKRHGGRKVLLDLSDPYLTVSGTNNVNAVTPPDLAEIGRLKWSAIDRRLYWQPDKGMMLIFR